MNKTAVGFILLSVSLFADDAQNTESPKMMVEEPMNNSSLKKNRTSWNYDQSGFMIYGEFLWWKLDESPTDYAYTKTVPVYQELPLSQPASGLVGEEHRATPKWSPGYRVGLAYQFSYAPWTLEGEYTRFTCENENETHFPGYNGVQSYTDSLGMLESVPVSTLNSTFSGFLFGNNTVVQSKLQFEYNVAHINLVRHLFADTAFVLSPYFGAQLAFIDQAWHITFVSDVPNNFCRTKTSWDFKGGGIDIGANIEWYWGAGFSFYANACAAALYGNHKHAISTIISTAPVETFQDTSKVETRTAQMTQLSAGVEWSYLFKNQAIALFVGWEFDTWYNLMEVRRFTESPTTSGGGNTFPTDTKPRTVDKSNINLQGLVSGVKWVF
jgi:hypothetical protein